MNYLFILLTQINECLCFQALMLTNLHWATFATSLGWGCREIF